MVFIPRAQPHAHSLFLFPMVFGINLIHFFDEKKDGAAKNSIVCFGASIPCHAINILTEVKRSRRVRIFGKLGTVSNSAAFLAKESVNSAPFTREETEVQIFGKEKCKILRRFQRIVETCSVGTDGGLAVNSLHLNTHLTFTPLCCFFSIED